MTVCTTSLVSDELRAVTAMLCARYPDRNHADVERLVSDVHREIAEHARITSHLIPLTLNRCRQLLSADTQRLVPARSSR